MMNFTPFGVPISAALPIATQFQAGKLTQNVTTANGQVVGVLQGGENGVHYIRPLDVNAFAQSSGQGNGQQAQTVITLPITMPGAKPGDPQQTVQIQVINQNAMSPPSPGQSPKYHMTPMSLQGFGQGATVLTVAYNPNQEGMQIIEGHNGMPIGEGMTVVAAIQPQDIQLIQTDDKKEMMPVSLIKSEMTKDDSQQEMATSIAIPANYVQATTTVQEYFQKMHHQSTLNLHPFLKFNTPGIKQENFGDDAVIEGMTITTESESGQQMVLNPVEYVENEESVDDPDKNKRRKKYKKKPPKPKKPKPGQVHIATALDGTTLFCCPECHMAYPEKELLEQHLVGHKIERRFICDICGAGLKRKEHLERHKLGHNPERPFVCSICMKGFKRKEHLNLHFVIHSGEKTEICDECGKGFYRKDHLRKHQRSHVTRRAKELAERQQSSLITTKDGTAQVTIQIDGQDGNPEGVTVVTTLQPQDVQLMQGDDKNNDKDPLLNSDSSKDEDRDQAVGGGVFDTNNLYSQNKMLQDYLLKLQQQNGPIPVSLQQFLKVNNIGIQQQEDLSGDHVMMPSSQLQIPVQIQVPQHHIQMANQTDDDSSQVSTVVLPSPSEGLAQHHIQMDTTTQDENGQVSTVVLPSSSEGLSIN